MRSVSKHEDERRTIIAIQQLYGARFSGMDQRADLPLSSLRNASNDNVSVHHR